MRRRRPGGPLVEAKAVAAPRVDRPPLIDGDLGWYYHTGPHAATPADWRVFLQFLDKYFTEGKS